MTDNTTNASNQAVQYRSPEARVISFKAQGILCGSEGDGPMKEKDYGDGGFGVG